MKIKNVNEATKEELLLYFFAPEFNGANRLRADKDRFLLWVNARRSKSLLDAQSRVAEQGSDYFKEYIALIKEADEEKDLDRKLAIYEKANKAYELWDRNRKEYNRLEKEIVNNIGI